MEQGTEENITSPGAPSRRGPRALLGAFSMILLVIALLAAGAGGVVYASMTAQPGKLSRSLNPDRYQPRTIAVVETATPQSQPTATAQAKHTSLGRIIYTPPTPTPRPAPPAPSAAQSIVVSLSKQQLWAYEGNTSVFTTLVTTGMPELPTPTGTFSISEKLTDVTFYSPWPQGSPYYYSPEHINYAMLFLTGGYFLHDASWRTDFGPGTNVPHTVNGVQETGSHGCVEMPVSSAAWLYNWVRMGAVVKIIP